MDIKSTAEINGRGHILALAFFGDGKNLLSSGKEKIIRQWRVRDGVEVGEGMRAGSTISAMDLSCDGNWIVSAGERVANVWSTRSRQIVVTVSDHSHWVDTVHVSLDSTKFATGCNDKTAFVWDISTGERLVGPLKHGDRVSAVRFSPDGDRIVTTTEKKGMRIYNAHNGELLRTIPVSVASYQAPIVWSSAQSILALVSHSTIMHIDANTGQTYSSWTIPGTPIYNFDGIAYGTIILSSNGRFIVSFFGHSVSFWDTSTSARISSDIKRPAHIWSIALSSDNSRLAIADANNKITLINLRDVISDHYLAGHKVVPQLRGRSGEDTQPENNDLCGKLRALELRIDELSQRTTRSHELIQVEELIPMRVSHGDYRIKSMTSDLYLTWSQDASGAVVVQDQSSGPRSWTISPVADGAYNITCSKHDLGALSVGNANALVCVSSGRHATWTVEPRGNAYVIGNAEDATAIHLTLPSRTVSVMARNNSQNQRWVLECSG